MNVVHKNSFSYSFTIWDNLQNRGFLRSKREIVVGQWGTTMIKLYFRMKSQKQMFLMFWGYKFSYWDCWKIFLFMGKMANYVCPIVFYFSKKRPKRWKDSYSNLVCKLHVIITLVQSNMIEIYFHHKLV